MIKWQEMSPRSSGLLELVKTGGWLMWPILLSSVIALGITIERFWTLRKATVAPNGLLDEVLSDWRGGRLSAERLSQLQIATPLGQILVAGIEQRAQNRETMMKSMEAAGIQVVHDLERYLSTLGTVAAIAPLLGLLGTVIGMIKVFSAIQLVGVGHASALAGGISEALITTATGLAVAIPALFCHRFLIRRIEELAIDMQQDAQRLVDHWYSAEAEDRPW
jgi:biopolymer transport protein ExbB